MNQKSLAIQVPLLAFGARPSAARVGGGGGGGVGGKVYARSSPSLS
jgi:hypothetical protein